MGFMVPPPMALNSNHNFKPLTMDIMREMIYSEDSDLNAMTLKSWKGEPTQIIDNLLENMYKLTVLAKTMDKFSDSKKLTHVQPYHNEKQQFRCYLSDTYIVIEVSPDTKTSGNWKHIIEKHGANKRDSKYWYKFDIVPNLSDDSLVKITTGIEMVIETVESHIFDIMNETNTVFEQVNTIRIGSKTRNEIKDEVRMRHEERKKIKDEETTQKQLKRKEFWGNILGLKSKITFT